MPSPLNPVGVVRGDHWSTLRKTTVQTKKDNFKQTLYQNVWPACHNLF